jgi:signal transduction histidine kinase
MRFERAVRAVAEAVEDLHGVAVDVVVVGDRELDPRSQALLAALREATVNAVRHAGGPVTVYAESGPDGVEAFVRDRGPGFDLGSVPQDRHGVKESIIARMHRHGGSAEVRSVPGEGTEVRLLMPDRDPPDRDASDRDASDRDATEQDAVHRTPPDSYSAAADDVPDPAHIDQEVTR